MLKEQGSCNLVQNMGQKGPVLRPTCIGPGRARTQILLYSILLYIGSPFFSVTCNLTTFLHFVDRLTGGTREKPNHEEAFLLWKREKDKLLKQKKMEQKLQKEKLKSDNEKKAAAEVVS